MTSHALQEGIKEFRKNFEGDNRPDGVGYQCALEIEAFLHSFARAIQKETEQELIKAIRGMFPPNVDLRPEIKEWTFNKNRSHAEGYQEALADCKRALEYFSEQRSLLEKGKEI